MTERQTASLNESIRLKINFTLHGHQQLFDPEEISKVEIFDSDMVTVLQIIESPNIIHHSLGVYYIDTDPSWNTIPKRQIFDKWYFKLLPTTQPTHLTQNCYIDEIILAKEDFRKGYAFNNPDLKANREWGAIITPDELRYIYAFGNKLEATATGEMFTNDILQWYIDSAVANVEADLHFKIIKQYIYSRETIKGKTRDDLSPEDLKQQNYIWDEPYDFNWSEFKRYMRIKLTHFPVLDVTKVLFRDPLGQLFHDFTSFVRVNGITDGSIEIVPNTLQMSYVPFFSQDPRFSGILSQEYYPDAWLIDYTVGFENAEMFKREYGELITVVGKLAAMNLLDDFGDGKSAAIASSSVSLAGISESLSTTMSATSAMFGARLESYRKELKMWWAKNQFRYGNQRLLFIAV